MSFMWLVGHAKLGISGRAREARRGPGSARNREMAALEKQRQLLVKEQERLQQEKAEKDKLK